MSVLFPDNSITIIRGSTKTLELSVTTAGSVVDLTGGTIYFSVKKDVLDRAPLIQKSSLVPAQVSIPFPRLGKASIYLLPSDTKNLDLGKYVFDVWFQTSMGERYPVIPPSVLEIVPSVTILS